MWLSFINSQLLLLIVPENSGSSTQVFHNQLKFRYTRFITLHYRQPVFDLGSREPYKSYPHPVSERTVLSLHCQLWLSDSVEFTCKYGQCRYITKSCSDDENNVIVKKIQCCLWISRLVFSYKCHWSHNTKLVLWATIYTSYRVPYMDAVFY